MTPDQSAALKQVREHMAALQVDVQAAAAAGAEPPFITGCNQALAEFFTYFVFALGLPTAEVFPDGSSKG